MPSFRFLIKESSGLGEGVAVRNHLNDLGSGGIIGDVTVNEIFGFDVETGDNGVSISIEAQTIEAFVDTSEITASIDEVVVDINITDQDTGVDL